jgi:hypothetical protein
VPFDLGHEHALSFFRVKQARHALDRLAERTTLDPSVVGDLDALAERITRRGVEPGHYYLPLPQDQGYAAFKTVGPRNDRLVLATILSKHMRPKGTPIGTELTKAAAPPDDGFSEQAPAKGRSWLPALATAGLVGAGAYKFLRTPRFSSNPMLARIQRKANQKGFHMLIDASRPSGPRTSQGLWDMLNQAAKPRVDAVGQLSPWNKVKLWMRGGGEAIPTYTKKVKGVEQKYVAGTPRGTATTQGLVHDRASNSDLQRRLRGGQDIEGTLESQRALTRLSRKGKDTEATFLQRHAPDAIPYTVADIGDAGVPAQYARLGKLKNRVSAAQDLQTKLKAHFKEHGYSDFLLKPTQGVASSGRFPRSGQDWGAHVEKYERHLADPTTRRAFLAAKRQGSNELANYLKANGIHEGHILHDGLRYPGDLLAQAEVKNPLGEFRVHTVGGSAPTELIMPRHRDSALQSLTSPVSKEELRAFAEQAVLRKLPAKYRKGMYGMDVMPFRRDDGSIGFRVIEMNPLERASRQAGGANSGLLDSDMTPLASHKLYRAATGRHTEPVALAGGIGAGLAGGSLARALTTDPEERG